MSEEDIDHFLTALAPRHAPEELVEFLRLRLPPYFPIRIDYEQFTDRTFGISKQIEVGRSDAADLAFTGAVTRPFLPADAAWPHDWPALPSSLTVGDHQYTGLHSPLGQYPTHRATLIDFNADHGVTIAFPSIRIAVLAAWVSLDFAAHFPTADRWTPRTGTPAYWYSPHFDYYPDETEIRAELAAVIAELVALEDPTPGWIPGEAPYWFDFEDWDRHPDAEKIERWLRHIIAPTPRA